MGNVQAQRLRAGFSSTEYIELLKASVMSQRDSAFSAQYEAPMNLKRIYTSPIVGLENAWDLWMDEREIAVISIRGTALSADSWLENFYAAMLPAKGRIVLNQRGDIFDYELAPHPKAAVHAGWLVGTAFLTQDILPQIDSLYRTGTRDFMVMGHSQGGAIAYLLTAHLLQLQQKGALPQDLRFKTYCSAAPKPGNIFFAYHYEDITKGGWAFNVVNPADWVPQVPISVQTLDDFNQVNPFRNADGIIKEQKLKERIVLKHVFNNLDKPTRKAQQSFQKYLGDMTEKMVLQKLTGLQIPAYVSSSDYVRTGQFVILENNEKYFSKFAMDAEDAFTHHLHNAYMEALDADNKLRDGLMRRAMVAKLERQGPGEVLAGTWIMNKFRGSEINTRGDVAPPTFEISEDLTEAKGFTGCNTFNAKLNVGPRVLQFMDVSTSRRQCEANIEGSFLEMLRHQIMWTVEREELNFLKDGKVVMTFTRSAK